MKSGPRIYTAVAVLSSNTPTALCVTNTTMEKDALTTVGPGMMLLDTFTVEKREKRFATLAGRDNTAQNVSIYNVHKGMVSRSMFNPMTPLSCASG